MPVPKLRKIAKHLLGEVIHLLCLGLQVHQEMGIAHGQFHSGHQIQLPSPVPSRPSQEFLIQKNRRLPAIDDTRNLRQKQFEKLTTVVVHAASLAAFIGAVLNSACPFLCQSNFSVSPLTKKMPQVQKSVRHKHRTHPPPPARPPSRRSNTNTEPARPLRKQRPTANAPGLKPTWAIPQGLEKP